MADTPAEVITLSLPSRLELLSVLDRAVLAIADFMEFGEDAASQLSMSVIEAGTNAIQHGHKKDASKTVQIRFEMYPDRLEVRVHDEGKGFALERVTPDVTTDDHLFDSRGRGIFIMRACCDTVDYTFGPDGTLCHMVKRRPVAPANATAD